MIDYIEGTLSSMGEDHIVMDIGGIGIQVYTSRSTLEAVPSGTAHFKLHTSLAIRENDVTMYGFSNETERELFRMLISVKGVGPKIAIGILSMASTDRLSDVIARGDAKALSAVKGVGKKMADRLVLELQDKVSALTLISGSTPAASHAHGDRAYSALKNLGYGDREAREAIQEVLKSNSDLALDEIIRQSLAILAK